MDLYILSNRVVATQILVGLQVGESTTSDGVQRLISDPLTLLIDPLSSIRITLCLVSTVMIKCFRDVLGSKA